MPIWLAGSALVVALIALVIALVALFLPFGVGAMGGMGGTDLGAGDGTVPGAVAGQQLSGDRIAYAVVDVLLQRGAEVEPGGVECETVLRLDDVSTAGCHGTVDGDDTWSGTAEFWSEQGDFTLYED